MLESDIGVVHAPLNQSLNVSIPLYEKAAYASMAKNTEIT